MIMLTQEIAIALIKLVENGRSDDLERAEFAFRGSTVEKMNEIYGESNSTRQEILDSLRRQRKTWEDVYAFVCSICGKER